MFSFHNIKSYHVHPNKNKNTSWHGFPKYSEPYSLTNIYKYSLHGLQCDDFFPPKTNSYFLFTKSSVRSCNREQTTARKMLAWKSISFCDNRIPEMSWGHPDIKCRYRQCGRSPFYTTTIFLHKKCFVFYLFMMYNSY